MIQEKFKGEGHHQDIYDRSMNNVRDDGHATRVNWKAWNAAPYWEARAKRLGSGGNPTGARARAGQRRRSNRTD